MITIENNIAHIEGTPKQLCLELTHLLVHIKKTLEKEEVNWQLFGLNITNPKRKETFLKILNKYVYYKDTPMTEEMLIEHNWSFKEIGEFLFIWCQISD